MNNAIMCFAQTAGARHQRGMARSPGSGSSPTRRRLLPQPQRQHAVQSGARLLLAAALAAACAGGLVAPRLLLRARSAASAAAPRAAASAPLISGRDACVRKVRDHNPDRGEGEGVADSCLVYAIIRILVDHRCLSFFFPVASSLVFPCLVASSPVDRRIYMRVWRGNLASGRPHHDRRAAGASDRSSPGRPVSASTPTPHRWRPRAACRPARSRRAIWRSKAACPRRPQSGGAPVCHRIQTGTAVPACTSSVMCVWYRSITGKFMNLKDSFGGISSWC